MWDTDENWALKDHEFHLSSAHSKSCKGLNLGNSELLNLELSRQSSALGIRITFGPGKYMERMSNSIRRKTNS
jgi:hypothetical protein